MQPGDIIVIQLTNDLPGNLSIPDTGEQGELPGNYSVCPDTDRYLDPASTNMHFHGMSVTPMCGGDQVTVVLRIHRQQSRQQQQQRGDHSVRQTERRHHQDYHCHRRPISGPAR